MLPPVNRRPVPDFCARQSQRIAPRSRSIAMKTSGFRVSGFIHTSAYIPPTNLVMSKGPATPEKKEVTNYENFHQRDTDAGPDEELPPGFPSGKKSRGVSMSRGPRPHRALAEALPIAQAAGHRPGVVPGLERIYDISIISKIPVTFARVMFAPQIMAAITEIAEDFRDEITKSGSLPGMRASRQSLASVQARDLAFFPRDRDRAYRDRPGRKLLVSGQTLA